MTISFGSIHRIQGVPDIDLSDSRILIVDDEPINVRLMTKVLEQAGFTQVRGTSDPREGLAIYRETPQDLVVLDLRMPGLSGMQVLAELKKLESGGYVPVLVMTAEDDPAVRLEALRAGARDFVGKPFDAHEVLSRIYNQLEVRYLYNRLIVQNATLEASVQARTQELTDARLEEVRRLVRTAEFRDNETGLHLVRMSKISAALAHQCGLPPAICEDILNASPMHDIGKIGVPDGILLKPGPLDAAEWETMCMHPIIGAEILSGHDSSLLRMAHDIALCHHEKWDGSGYPHGLAETDIPLAARIVAVADVFDALTSKRPYKAAWPVSRALAEMDRMAGAHLDPALVVCLHEIQTEVETILVANAEPDGVSRLQRIQSETLLGTNRFR
ncbi:HD domain-containing phosphohydrolase [Rhodoferax sp. GW822-FHT02A01]|uniref:HD domain-containing phosphohydrolase n=1 Tax=Rhodoferax sp. GW822-FHT02A01 TaxID=3141537 RepID=UPI00315D6B51